MTKVGEGRAVKTAISLPSGTYERAEALRRENGQSRSELYAAALQVYFKALEVREKEARYVAGYRDKPEDIDEIAAVARAGAAAFPREDW
ncbi:MAG: hypothetical protein ABII00_12570 [Elusimicrobiota bacterium]